MNTFLHLIRIPKYIGALAFIGFLLSTGTVATAQLVSTRSALNRMHKEQWDEAERALLKSMEKDTINPMAKYVYATWYFSSQNPRYHIDSAYYYLQGSLHDFSVSTEKQREQSKRFPLDSSLLLQFRGRIDSAAFNRARKDHSEASYNYFLDHFTFADEREEAEVLRDDIAFSNAQQINTYQAFQDFLTCYPYSRRSEEAKEHYEKRLFEDKTKEGTRESFISFYNEYPTSPYRSETERNIFEITTTSGEESDFLMFLQSYSGSKWEKRARDMVYHIAKFYGREVPEIILNDSSREISSLEQEYWVPVLKEDRFGFVDQHGTIRIPPRYREIERAYRCKALKEDYVVTSEEVVSRSDKKLYEGKVENSIDLGLGILFIQSNSCGRLIHKSGFTLTDQCIAEAKLILNRFIAVRINIRWGLMALNGRRLTGLEYEHIESGEGVIVVDRNGKKHIYTVQQIVEEDTLSSTSSGVFDEVRIINENVFLVRQGEQEGALNAALEFVVPLGPYKLSMTSFGLVKEVDNKVEPVGISDALEGKKFDSITPYRIWLSLRSNDTTLLYHRPSHRIVKRDLDSLWFSNGLAIALQNDSLHVFFRPQKKIVLPAHLKVTFVPSTDTLKHYYYYKKNGKNQVFNMDTGARMFTASFESFESMGYNVFRVSHAGKLGLVDERGKTLLKSEYGSIIPSPDGMLSLLKNGKIGLYNRDKKTFIPPSYERKIIPYTDSVFIVYKNGHYGFLDGEANPLSGFEFEEIIFWNNKSALTRKGNQWSIYNLYTQEIERDHITKYSLWKDGTGGQTAVVYRENQYGVLSSTQGIIIPAAFHDLINIGTDEKPFYFADKYIQEARLHVVIYYNEQGVMQHRQVYENPEYDKIYCSIIKK